ncbi:hypothetical protein [Luedemannella helvata]|uniref:Uncharacterized protein n=1 Tax=Luedemannella helvata TaxID=349315 RepID=A0ABP4WSY0_9ACTN
MEQPRPVTVETGAGAPGWDRAQVMLPVFAVIALLGGLFPSFSLSANLLVVLVGGVMCWLGLAGRLGRRPAPTRLRRGALAWLVPVLTLALVELYTFSRKDPAHPTLSLLADPVLDGYLARAACYFVWLAGFWGLVRR